MNLPPPELRKCGNFFRRDDYWVASGMMEAERLRDFHKMNATSKILDVGCGAGRLPRGILETKLPFGSYTGVDVSEPAIDWCQEHLARPPNVRFHALDIHNERYNPGGTIRMDDLFRLPFNDKAFSIIYSWSLFTHLRLRDAQTYLREFRRLLTPGGSIFLTAFVETAVPDEEENPAGYPPGKSDQGALHRVRFSSDAMEMAIEDAELEIVDYNHHSCWNFQSTFKLVRP